jgi:GTPase
MTPRRGNGDEAGKDRDEERSEASRPPREEIIETGLDDPRAVLIFVSTQRPDRDLFSELASLCDTAGIQVVGEMVQVRQSPSPSHYLGKGKTVELAELVIEAKADLVVVDEELSPTQGRNLEKALEGVRVVDRSELILSIFENNAKSNQARIQVELARRRYELPRLRRLWTHLHRERGGIGAMGGMGEKQIEIDRRLLRSRIKKLEVKLAEIEARKQREIDGRSRQFKVSLVGYTNAGKSTLMNRLTDAGVLEENRLFSTLDTRTKRWDMGEGRFSLLSDTVGFIRRIPHHLVASFHATLAEALDAHLLLLVVDASDPEAEEEADTVLEVLGEIGAEGKEILVVLNKIDRLPDPDQLVFLRQKFPDACAVSARAGEGVEGLRDAVLAHLDRFSSEEWLAFAHERGDLQGQLRHLATVIDTHFTAERAYFKVRITPDVLAALEAKGVERLEASPIESATDPRGA